MSCTTARRLDLLGYDNTPVHRLDSRVKVIAAFLFVVCVASFPKYAVAPLIPCFIVPVALGALGGVPTGLVLRMLAVAAPFAVLVGLFNPLLDRAPLAVLGPLTVTGGWVSLVSILLRFALSVSMILVLTATTSVPGLLHGLYKLRVPRAFITQVHFLYRYLFLLAEEGERLGRARRLRDPRRRLPAPATAFRLLGALLWRTWERADRVYCCMRARGFQGDFPHRAPDRLRASDAVFLGAMMLFCAAARFLPLTHWLGGLLTGGAA